MTIAVILVLGVLWVAVLVPPILRARGQQGRTDSVGDFTYKLSTLGRANGSHRNRPSRTSSQKPIFVPTRGNPPEPQSGWVHYVPDAATAMREAKAAAGDQDIVSWLALTFALENGG